MSTKDPNEDREALIKTAIDFLSHPQVRESSVAAKRAFLESRGLTNDEVETAFTSAEKVRQEQHPVRTLGPVMERPMVVPPPRSVSAGTSIQTVLAKGILAVGFLGGTFLAFRNYIMPIVQRWSEELAFLREKRYEELKDILSSVQEAHQEHCARMEHLMYNYTSELREIHTQNEEMMRDYNEETQKLLNEIKEMLRLQVQTSRPNLSEEGRERSSSPLSSIVEPPATEDHPTTTVFGSVSIRAEPSDVDDLPRMGSVPRKWMQSASQKETMDAALVDEDTPVESLAEWSGHDAHHSHHSPDNTDGLPVKEKTENDAQTELD